MRIRVMRIRVVRGNPVVHQNELENENQDRSLKSVFVKKLQKKILNFAKFWQFFDPFLKNQCFWKNSNSEWVKIFGCSKFGKFQLIFVYEFKVKFKFLFYLQSHSRFWCNGSLTSIFIIEPTTYMEGFTYLIIWLIFDAKPTRLFIAFS